MSVATTQRSLHAQQPVLFLSHGSPLTALGGDDLNACWAALAGRLRQPDAIVMVSAHWNTRLPILSGSAQPDTIHDFGGFPEALYEMRYPAPGQPALARRIKALFAERGIVAGIDATRGLDHGAWVPLRTLFPASDVPVVQLSVQPEHDARHHFALGTALAPLLEENVLIISSGHMTHNLGEYMRNQPRAPETVAFRDWVHERLMRGDSAPLLDWLQLAPQATFAHPSVEHFLPLFVALGAAGHEPATEWLGGGWVADTLAADNYLFVPATA